MKKILFHIVCIILSSVFVNAQFTNLYDFYGVNGVNPTVDLTTDGTYLYGTTDNGGTNASGTIFKILPDGSGYIKLLDFPNVPSGCLPFGSLFYNGTSLIGTSFLGGTGNNGTIYSINTDGSGFNYLYQFTGLPDGSKPRATLISDGTFLYGTTSRGGINNSGTIFKILPDGTGYSKIWDFDGTLNGYDVRSSLYFDGTFLYGMTNEGGVNNLGIIYKILPTGTGFTKLLDFQGALNGSHPRGALISDGIYLYGMTSEGGINDSGIVFKILPNGTGFQKLLDFGGTNGSKPYGSLKKEGSYLYGTTNGGGMNGLGTLFKIMPDGSGYTNLFDFSGGTNGSLPYGSLISDGYFLYGMTFSGGVADLGTLFKYQYAYIGIPDAEQENSLNLFPNPVSDHRIFIASETEIEQIEIFNLSGQSIYQNYPQTGSTSLALQFQEIAPGIYVIKIRTNKGTITRKIIFQ